MKITQDLQVIYGILRFGGTPEEILRHTSASRHTG
jgi:hypothetical protein